MFQTLFDFLFKQYGDYSTLHIVLELVAAAFGVWSVWLAKKENIWVYPTGLLSTGIYVYLLYQWSLLGDMLINAYYFAMSVYGWYVWTRKVDDTHFIPITRTSIKEKWISGWLFVASILFVYLVYKGFDRWNFWSARIDTLTTALFFVAMWLMAKKKIENWIYWIIGDLISIPLYFYKGYTFTAFQYFIFLVIAIFGYISWKTHLRNNLQTASR